MLVDGGLNRLRGGSGVRGEVRSEVVLAQQSRNLTQLDDEKGVVGDMELEDDGVVRG